MSYIRDKLLRKISLFVLTSAILGVVINSYVIYPSFTKLVQKNTEDKAIQVAKRISVNFFPKEGISPNTPTLSIINKLVNDFEFMKLKSFDSNGKIIFSTDSEEIGEVNKKEYFHTVVAKGSIYSKQAKKSSLSMEGQRVTTDVIEIYVPVMRAGTFVGAFEINYDISKDNRFLHQALFSSNLLSTGLLSLFLIIIFLILFRLDKIICLHKKNHEELEESYSGLNIAKIEIEKNHEDLQNAFEQISSLIQKVSTTQDVKLRFEN